MAAPHGSSPGADAEIVQRVIRGDVEALGHLYDRHAAALFTLARRLAESDDDAEDVVHDVFVGLPEALRRYEERGRLGPWLKRVTARLALDRVRARRRAEARARRGAPDVDGGRAQDAALCTALTLHDAVARLPVTLRSVLVLKEIEGFSHAEIAALLGISVGASEVRLHRALRALRHSMSG
jgi:RNA polymerase sigma-70 factor (ECF subfamily)